MTRAGVLLFAPILGCAAVYGDLGQPLDPSTTFRGASETYLFATPERTSLVIFGEQDEEGVGQIAWATIERNTETRLITGTYRAPEEDSMVASFDILYFTSYEFDRPAIERIGSRTTMLEVPIEYTGSVTLGADQATIETESGPQTLTRLGSVLERVDPTTAGGQLLLARLYNCAKLVSLSRVVGFGGPGLFMYSGRVGEFRGLQRGRQEVSFRDTFSPKTSFTYVEFTDLTGFVYDGSYESHTDTSATGTMIGSVDFSMDTDRTLPPLFSGTAFYDDLLVNDGVPNEGVYRFVLDDGTEFETPATEFHDIDLSQLFP